MNSLELRKDPSSGDGIVMYGFESKPTIRDLNGNKIIFLGSKEQLIEKYKEFWERSTEDYNRELGKILDHRTVLGSYFFMDYRSGYCNVTGTYSLRSAIESTKGNHILIVRERI